MEIKQCGKSLPTGEVWWGFSFCGGLVGLLITPLFSPQNSLLFPSKLTEFYIANRHVMKEIILAQNI